jgi:hypothetical protein
MPLPLSSQINGSLCTYEIYSSYIKKKKKKTRIAMRSNGPQKQVQVEIAKSCGATGIL